MGIEDYEELAIGLDVPDPNDAHVLVAALKLQAQIIITYNLKDFPEKSLVKYQVEALHPDTFLRSQLDLYLPVFLSSAKTIRSRLKHPPKSAQEYLFTLYHHLPQTISILKAYAEVI